MTDNLSIILYQDIMELGFSYFMICACDRSCDIKIEAQLSAWRRNRP